jgi:glycogen debranching enzyme
MRDELSRFISLDDFSGLPSHVVNLFRSLEGVTTPIGIQASSGSKYRGAIFGRDSLRVALDLVPWLPQIAEQVLTSLAWLQGDTSDPQSEEEPGKIPHEYRTPVLGRRPIDAEQYATLEKLRRLWKSTDGEVIYYGSVDATPQFIRLVGAAALSHGRHILDLQFVHKTGNVRSIRESVREAALFLEREIHASDLTLLEFQRKNPNGHRYQAMRDGVTSYFHASTGELANPDAPIASLEIQGFAYDALRMAATLLSSTPTDPLKRWNDLALTLRASMLRHFWLPGEDFFAMAIDRSPSGPARPLVTRSSNAAELLETTIFDELPTLERRRYVCSIVNAMYSDDFLTDAGIRMLARRHSDVLPYWDYQGSFTTWITVSDSFARGLRRLGLHQQAFDIEARMLNAINLTGELVEFLFVDEDGRVDYDPFGEQLPASSSPITIPGVDVPQANQAWTISAALRAILARALPPAIGGAEQPDNREFLPGLTSAATRPGPHLIRTLQDAIDTFPKNYRFRVDLNEGRRRLLEHWSRRNVRLYLHDDPLNPD